MSHAKTDHTLLYGILAMQMAFVDREQLLSSMNTWMIAKNRELGKILCQQNALTEEERELLDALVAKHLQQNNGDIQRCLSDLSSISHIVGELQQVADTDLQQSLQYATIAPPTETSHQHTPSWFSEGEDSRRFRILRPHAKGGLGQVSVAMDQQLRREVALKELQSRHADNQESRTRFVAEAEITGGLEHPGIVPVYGLGHYADGRPFYAMRFVRGDSLAEAVDRFHLHPAPDASEQALLLRRLLGRVVDVCEAVQYAHSRGVLHRDLKPGNIMLGKHGETLVVDWGLAKPTDGANASSSVDESLLQPSLSGDLPETMMGSAVGTPSYMSPEQAAGNYDQLGPRSDVYSLGATLYCLLTGQSPIGGDDVNEILEKTRAGVFPRPRQVNRKIAPALESICLCAMETMPEARYATPKQLADDIERWLADEPVKAHPESMVRRTQRWLRKHRGVALVASATLVLVAAVASIASVMIGRARDDALQSAEDRREALVVVEQQRDRAKRETDRATAAEAKTRGALTQVEQARSRAERVAYNSTLSEASRLVGSEPMLARSLLESESRCPVHLRDFVWHCLYHQVVREERAVSFDSPGASAIVYSPDGKVIASSGDAIGVALWDAATGKRLGHLECPQEALQFLRFSADGASLAAAASSKAPWDGSGPQFAATTYLFTWNLASRELTRQHTIQTDSEGVLTAGPDGFHYHWFYTEQQHATNDDEYRRNVEWQGQYSRWCRWSDFNLETGNRSLKLIQCGDATQLQSVDFYGDHLLVCYGNTLVDGFAWMFDTRTKTAATLDNWHTPQDVYRMLLFADVEQVRHLTFTYDDESMDQIDSLVEVFSATFDLELGLEKWDLSNHRQEQGVSFGRFRTGMFIENRGNVAAADRIGRYQAALMDRRPVIQLFDLEHLEVYRTVPAHVGDITNVAIAPNGHQMVSVGLDRMMRLWDIPKLCADTTYVPVSVERPTRLLISPDNQQLLILGKGPEPPEYDDTPPDEQGDPPAPGGSASEESTANQPLPLFQAEIRQLSDVKPGSPIDFGDPPSPLPDRSEGLAGVVGIFGAFGSAIGESLGGMFSSHPLERNAGQLAVSPDGSQLIYAPNDRLLRFDLKTGQGEELWGDRHLDRNRAEPLQKITFTSDLTKFATLNVEDQAIQIYDMKSKQLLWKLPSDKRRVDRIMLSPDNNTLLVVRDQVEGEPMQEPCRPELWDLTTQSQRTVDMPEFMYVEDWSFSPDGTYLIANLTLDRRVAVLEVDTGQNISQLIVNYETPAGMLPGSDLLVLLGEQGEMKIWDVRLNQYHASLQVFENEPIIDYQLSTDHQTMVVLGKRGSLRFLGADRLRDDLADVYKLMHTRSMPAKQTLEKQLRDKTRPNDAATSDSPVIPEIEIKDYDPQLLDEMVEQFREGNQNDSESSPPPPPAGFTPPAPAQNAPIPPRPIADPDA